MTEAVQPIVRRGAAPGRCAYCHGDVALEERSACAACLAVHHGDCWARDRKCAACGETRLLAAVSVSPAPAPEDPLVSGIGRELILLGNRDVRRAVIRATPELKWRQDRVRVALVVVCVLLAVSSSLLRPWFAVLPFVGFVATVLYQIFAVLLPAKRRLAELQQQIRGEPAPRPARTDPKKDPA